MAADLSQAALLYRSGQERNFPIPDRPSIRVGFDRSNDVAIPFEGVSRNHARISFDGKAYWIEDAGSSNGTFLNGRRVTKKQRIVNLDVVTLGRKTDLIFVRKHVKAVRTTRRGILAAWLESLDGSEAGSRREIPRGSITIGRSPASSVIVESNLVSKMHARLERSGLGLMLIDLHSSNGTFVNGERIDSKLLIDGDEFSVGGSRNYRVHIHEGEIEVGEASVLSASRALPQPLLPTDWKTRIEWSPEERAIFDDFRKDAASSSDTAPRPPVATPERPAAPKAQPAPKPERVVKPEPKPEVEAAPKPPPMPAPEAKPKEALAPKPEPAVQPAAAPEPERAPRQKPAPPSRVASPGGETISMPLPAPPPAAAPPPQAQRRIHLEGKAQSFSMGVGDHDIGRVPGVAIRIEGPQISRRHALLHVTANEIVIEDLGSANGTFVNGKRITGRQPLIDGDLVQFGDLGFRVRTGFEAEGPGRPPDREA